MHLFNWRVVAAMLLFKVHTSVDQHVGLVKVRQVLLMHCAMLHDCSLKWRVTVVIVIVDGWHMHMHVKVKRVQHFFYRVWLCGAEVKKTDDQRKNYFRV